MRNDPIRGRRLKQQQQQQLPYPFDILPCLKAGDSSCYTDGSSS